MYVTEKYSHHDYLNDCPNAISYATTTAAPWLLASLIPLAPQIMTLQIRLFNSFFVASAMNFPNAPVIACAA
jgi:hypothetical protein